MTEVLLHASSHWHHIDALRAGKAKKIANAAWPLASQMQCAAEFFAIRAPEL